MNPQDMMQDKNFRERFRLFQIDYSPFAIRAVVPIILTVSALIGNWIISYLLVTLLGFDMQPAINILTMIGWYGLLAFWSGVRESESYAQGYGSGHQACYIEIQERRNAE